MKRVRDPQQLRAAIARRAVSQHELARLARCTQGTIAFVLAGRPVNDDIARRIARAVKGPVSDLFQAVDANSEQQIPQQHTASA